MSKKDHADKLRKLLERAGIRITRLVNGSKAYRLVARFA